MIDDDKHTNIYTMPAGLDFADCLTHGIITHYRNAPEVLAKTTVFLPNAQLISALRESFFKINKGKVLLLPKMRVWGALDEAEKTALPTHKNPIFHSLYTHKPIPNALRIPALGQLILDNPVVCPHITDYQSALSHASHVLDLLDLLSSHNTLLSVLETLDANKHAPQWHKTLEAVFPIVQLWHDFLNDNHFLDIPHHKALLYKYMADYWTNSPTNNPVIVAGIMTYDALMMPFLQAIHNAPTGHIIILGLDTHLSDNDISHLSPDHPQHSLHNFLRDLNIHHKQVKPWHHVNNLVTPEISLRTHLLSEIMRPSATTEEWCTLQTRLSDDDIITATQSLKIIAAPNERTEATAIALVIREALEKPHQKIALVSATPDFLSRVCSVLGRWQIKPTNHASVPLGQTPQGLYIRLLCDVLQDNFSAVSVLALLKNPLSTAGLPAGEFKQQVLLFEKYILRGNVIHNGLVSYHTLLNTKAKKLKPNIHKCLSDFLGDLTKKFSDILALPNRVTMLEFITIFKNLLANLTSLDTDTDIFFNDDAGQKILEVFDMHIQNSHFIGIIPTHYCYQHILNILNSTCVRVNDYTANPNITLYAPSDLCFITADIVIIAGLTEGIFPVAPKTGVWVSRDMRHALGLPLPESLIGADAFYFSKGFCNLKVFLSYAHEANGSPTIASRWLIRLESILKGAVKNPKVLAHLYDTPYIAWGKMLDNVDVKPKPARRPEPKPPVHIRPKSISVTDAEKWIRDPYAIYCKHILKLRKLQDINQDLEASEKGNIIHTLLHDFTVATIHGFEGKPHKIMHDLVTQILDTLKSNPVLYLFWKDRLMSDAMQFVDFEIDRRKSAIPIMYEQDGSFSFATSNGDFTINARCDRVDKHKNGQAILVDYKTSSGASATYEQMKAGFAPQLPLQAMMLMGGGFGTQYHVGEAEYIIINKGIETKEMKPKGEITDDPLFCDLTETIFNQFKDWVELFNDENTGYISRRLPEFLKFTGDYDLLARVPEWNIADDDSDED